jgi:hypothetical protein
MHYLPRGDESSPRGRWGICVPALPEVLTHPRNAESRIPFRFIGPDLSVVRRRGCIRLVFVCDAPANGVL